MLKEMYFAIAPTQAQYFFEIIKKNIFIQK